MSPIASYAVVQNLNTGILTNGGAISPFASYQCLDNLSSEVASNSSIVSPFASYQFQENLASEVLSNGSPITPFASYQHLENLNVEILSNGNLISPIDSYFFYAWPGTVVISNQPCSCIVQAGSTASFFVVVGGEPPFNYQWWFQHSPIVGATNAGLTISNVQSANSGNYWVTIGNLYGWTNSIVASLDFYQGTVGQGWTIKTYRNGSPVNGLADADALSRGNCLIASTNMAEGDMVGFSTGEGTGHFSINNPVPGIPNTQATDNYAVQGAGFLVVPNTGQYTFGLNTDDGARLRIDGSNVIVDDVRSAPHDCAYVTVSLSAGLHPIEWTWFNEAGGVNGGGAEAEMFAASGVHTGFDSSFQLVGDAPGLVVVLGYSAPINIVQTNRAPTSTEVGNPTIPTDPNHLKVFASGTFQSGIALDPNKMTVVLTHGWNGSPSDWAEYMAQIIQERIGVNAVNILAWDWTRDAQSDFLHLTDIAGRTPGEGGALGRDLIAALGANYAQRIHFIGHSLGTLVNAAAANYVHSHGFSWANTQMTLCDDAEIAWGVGANGLWQFTTTLRSTLVRLIQNASTTEPYWGQALPNQFAWADNYISACGLLHPEAANATLNFTYPGPVGDMNTFRQEFYNFHYYAHYFYEDTIEPGIFNTGGQINPTYMGFICSFEGGGAGSRPGANTYFYQDPNGLELNLVQTDFGLATSFLNARFNSFFGTLKSTVANIAVNEVVQGSGQVIGLIDNLGNMIINLISSGGISSQTRNGAPHPLGGPLPNGGSASNTPAYAWIPLIVPSNAVSMSFDFMLQGNGNNDFFQAALNGTNVLSLETSLIETNITMNSGLIAVSQYAGTNVELFLGIVGGTSTNAQLTVSTIQFYSVVLPSLEAQAIGPNLVLSWPLSAENFGLQTTTNLADPNSWVTLTNVPAIVDFQNAITNASSGSQGFYRLMQFPQ